MISLAVLDNGGIPKDGGLTSDRSSRRRGRRQKTPTRLSDGKYRPLSSEKENTEVGQPRSTNTIPEESGMYSLKLQLLGL